MYTYTYTYIIYVYIYKHTHEYIYIYIYHIHGAQNCSHFASQASTIGTWTLWVLSPTTTLILKGVLSKGRGLVGMREP